LTAVYLNGVDARYTNAIKWADFKNLDILVIFTSFSYTPIRLSTIENPNLKKLELTDAIDIDGIDRDVLTFSKV